LARYLAFFLVAVSLYCKQHNADRSCPWLNAATAAGILGGPIRSEATATICEFVRRQAHVQYRLRIEVRTTTKVHKEFASYLSRCGRKRTPLKGIGNEAYACAQDHRVVGRVRDQVFSVRLTTTDHSIAPNVLEENARTVADQVAGSLF